MQVTMKYISRRTLHGSDFIERLNNNYQTMIGENGVKLSGGKKKTFVIDILKIVK